MERKETLASKIVPYSLYILLVVGASLSAWVKSRDPELESWKKFAAHNKHVVVTNIIHTPNSGQQPEFLAVEIAGCRRPDEKRAISAQSARIVNLPFTPEIGDSLMLTLKQGQIQVEKTATCQK